MGRGNFVSISRKENSITQKQTRNAYKCPNKMQYKWLFPFTVELPNSYYGSTGIEKALKKVLSAFFSKEDNKDG
jgi:hypothetical protein